jgi:hypothetical protein
MRGAKRDHGARGGAPTTSSRLLVLGWAGLGLAGSLLLSAAGTQLLDHQPVSWWVTVHLGSATAAHNLFWVGVGLLCLAWAGLGLELRRAGPLLAPARLGWIGLLWALPLALGTALFSRDMYSYLADGQLLRLGLDPYTHAPAALAAVHQRALLSTVSPFWRHTTAPYGPVFVGLAAAIAAICGGHLVVAIVLLRVFELVGVALLANFVPRLARALGADPAWASWLAVISPVVALELVAAGHNDALMAGLLVCGTYLAVQRRPLVAIAVCTLAATVKLPALAAVVMIVISWLREDASNRREAARIAGAAVAVCAAVLIAAGLITGVGLHWLSGSLLSTPGKVHLAITPATAIGYSIHSLLHTLGLHPGASARPLEKDLGHVTVALTGLYALWLCWRVNYERLTTSLALLLLASVIGGPATWPWYLCWGISLAACTPQLQRLPWLWLVSILGALAVYPNGQLRFPVTSSPYVLAAYAAAVAAAAWMWRTRRGTRNGWRVPHNLARGRGVSPERPAAELLR